MKYLTYAFAFFTLILIGACSDSPFSPPVEKNPPPGNETTFGLVEVTISGIGTENMNARAIPAGSVTAYSFTGPQNGDNSGDGSIQMEAISNGSFTTGIRGSDGMRYLYATFKVRNAQNDGTPYDTPRENLTFMAAENASTLGETAFVELRLFDGTTLPTYPQGVDMAKTIIPTGKVVYLGGEVVPAKSDVLQIIKILEANAIPVPTGVNMFPFGFVTRSPHTTPGSRQLPASPAAGQFDGIVTFAFKIPLQAQANQDAFEITALFLPVDDSEVRLTQSIEEQSPDAAATIADRAAELNALYITLFPGNSFTDVAPIRRICGPVRVAGDPLPATPTAVLFPAFPVLQNSTPDPYVGDGSSSHIPANTAFSAAYDITIQAANANNFVVNSGQSGRLFTGGGYTTSGSTATTPAGSYFPGERVEVTLTPGLGSCLPTVARYRVAAGAGPGTFTETLIAVGNTPDGITAGDLDGDGDLDLALANANDDNISLLAGDGIGGFTETTVAVGDFPISVTAGDWDGDGDLDLAVVNLYDATVSLMENNGSGGFIQTTVAVGGDPQEVTAGDWNGDGDLDIAVVNADDDNISLLENDGDGVFIATTTVAVGYTPTSVAVGDWDSDGDLDMVVVDFLDDTMHLLENNGTGEFSSTPIGSPTGPGAVTAGDWDSDGDLDLAVASGSGGTIHLMENNGFGTFTGTPIAVGANPASVIAGDWDGDGDLDLAVTNANDGTINLLENDGLGSFTKTTVAVGNGPRSVTAGDWDGDGDLDLAVANDNDDNISLLINQPVI